MISTFGFRAFKFICPSFPRSKETVKQDETKNKGNKQTFSFQIGRIDDSIQIDESTSGSNNTLVFVVSLKEEKKRKRKKNSVRIKSHNVRTLFPTPIN
jgi:hypothetical protein